MQTFYVVVTHYTDSLGARGDRCDVVVAADCTGGCTGVLGGDDALGGDRSCVVVAEDCDGDCTGVVLGGDHMVVAVVTVNTYCSGFSDSRYRALGRALV